MTAISARVHASSNASMVAIEDPSGELEAAIRCETRDPALSTKIARAIADRLHGFEVPALAPSTRVLRLRTRRRLDGWSDEHVRDAIVVIDLTGATATRARKLPDLVDAIRARSGVLGVQVLWDGADRDLRGGERHEEHVFTMLERVRTTPAGPPVVVVDSGAAIPSLALRFLLSSRQASSVSGSKAHTMGRSTTLLTKGRAGGRSHV